MKNFVKISAGALCLLTSALSVNINAQGLVGEWSGQLEVTPQMNLRLVLHIEENAVYLDSPDQAAYGIPGDVVFLSEDSVNVNIPKIIPQIAVTIISSTFKIFIAIFILCKPHSIMIYK